jgi:hypothetical protein
MKLFEFDPPLDEAPMNPKAFAQAVEAGQDKGVLVGFEFEVGIPHEVFAKASSQEEEKTPNRIQDIVYESDVLENLSFRDCSVTQWDEVFKFKVAPPTGVKSMTEAYTAFRDSQLTKSRELFNAIPERLRAKYRDEMVKDAKEWAKRNYGHLDKDDPERRAMLQLHFAKLLGHRIYMVSNPNSKTEAAGRELRQAGELDWAELLKFVFNVDRAFEVERNFNDYFTYDVDQAWDTLRLDDIEDDDDYDDDEDGDYESAATALQPIVSQTMGAKVNVFHSYHQSAKNLTDWYIEPDGSLDANEDLDATAEIVSPPLPAAQAVDALKRFYAMAGQLNLYTNESTGLHINVSIPDKLDVLKLAVFLGDQHVLKQFGRQDSSYAVSAEKSIAHQTAGNPDIIDVKTKKKPGVLGQPKTKSTINVKALQQIAQDATKAHVASISNNGKYISFRHAGGNYLQDYTSIFNVVGRFIRAMIIAADPNAYAQEYQTKLAKLAGTSRTPASQGTPALVSYVRTNGLPVIKIDVMRFNNTRSALNLAKDAMQGMVISDSLNNQNVSVLPGGEAARQAIATKIQNPRRKETVEKAPVQNFFSLTIVPSDVNTMKKFLNLDLGGGVAAIDNYNGYTDTGYAIYSKAVLPITDPVSKTYLKTMLTQHYSKKLKK